MRIIGKSALYFTSAIGAVILAAVVADAAAVLAAMHANARDRRNGR